MQQPDLFGRPVIHDVHKVSPSAPYQPGSETSKTAAKAIRSETLTRQCVELEDLYRKHGPLSDADAADLLRWERSTVIPRRHELMAAAKVRKVGVRVNEKSGQPNTTYGVTSE